MPRNSLPRLAGFGERPPAEDAADAPSASIGGDLPQALLQGRARPPRLLFLIEMPRHVAVPLPEPLRHPEFPRILIRRVPSHRRLRGGDASDGARRPAPRRGDLPQRTGGRNSVRRPPDSSWPTGPRAGKS